MDTYWEEFPLDFKNEIHTKVDVSSSSRMMMDISSMCGFVVMSAALAWQQSACVVACAPQSMRNIPIIYFYASATSSVLSCKSRQINILLHTLIMTELIQIPIQVANTFTLLASELQWYWRQSLHQHWQGYDCLQFNSHLLQHELFRSRGPPEALGDLEKYIFAHAANYNLQSNEIKKRRDYRLPEV